MRKVREWEYYMNEVTKIEKESKKMNRADVLRTAEKMVCGHREQDYGSPEDNFQVIANFWSDYKDIEFNTVDVAMMMALLKIARISTGAGTDDSFVDLAGYAACGAECKDRYSGDIDEITNAMELAESKFNIHALNSSEFSFVNEVCRIVRNTRLSFDESRDIGDRLASREIFTLKDLIELYNIDAGGRMGMRFSTYEWASTDFKFVEGERAVNWYIDVETCNCRKKVEESK